jgi:hypothetical protein
MSNRREYEDIFAIEVGRNEEGMYVANAVGASGHPEFAVSPFEADDIRVAILGIFAEINEHVDWEDFEKHV